VSERWKAAVLWMGLVVASPSQACGTPGASVALRSVSPAGEVVLEPGGPARLAGLALDDRAVAALGARVGQTLGAAYLAPSADRWGRRAVDLFETGGRSLSLGLLENGYARVRADPDTRGCETERLEAEQGARLAGEGLWADPGAVIDAADLKALAAHDGRFTLVRGRVRRTGATATRFYLDFEPYRGLSVVASRKLETQFRRAGRDVMDLAGRMVLVRGVLDNRFGPRIEIADPMMIEPLESAKESSRGG
jgi:micrococcal nuclease